MPTSPDLLASAQDAAQAWLPDARISVLGDGHIHDTFLLEPRQQSTVGRLVLQRLNQVVFVDPDLVMSQTRRVLSCWSEHSQYVCPVLQTTRNGDDFFRSAKDVWRAWQYVAGRTVDPPNLASQAHAAGKAFAQFQSTLAQLPGPRLRATIDYFLDLNHYLGEYDQVAARAPQDLADSVDRHRHLEDVLGPANGHIHGDCKIDNLLFTSGEETVLAVLDFDTAMYGQRALDFGDLVRSICVSLGRVDLEMFEACLRGFHAGGIDLSAQEALAAPRYVTFMLGVRFLTDHLNSDIYFKVAAPGENLERARRQFALLNAMNEHLPQLQKIVNKTQGQSPFRQKGSDPEFYRDSEKGSDPR